MSTMLVLFYLFCDGKTEDNLSQMFNMFDMDGNKVECIGFIFCIATRPGRFIVPRDLIESTSVLGDNH